MISKNLETPYGTGDVKMKKQRKRAVVLLLAAAVLMGTLSGCGCGKKKKADPETQQVMKISITPAVTPTPSVEEVNPDAVVTKDGITMVNSYLAEKETAQPSPKEEETEGTEEVLSDEEDGVDISEES